MVASAVWRCRRAFRWQIDPSKLGASHALIWAGSGYDDPSGIC
jgi:hypothetical protein